MKFNKNFVFLIASFLISFVISPMAHNIYSDPDLSNTSKEFDAFTIDFRGIDTPYKTYWALCNWQMDLTEFKKTHKDVSGGGAYGGLQMSDEKKAILSFWEVLYTENGEKKSSRASRMYPKGDERTFGGEGEGTNYIDKYDWPTGVWHRYTLYSWKDDSTGKTFVGQWIQNLETKKWTLFAIFNTQLENSFITGGLSQFQENYNAKYSDYERSFQIKNMYAFDRRSKVWVSLNTTTLAYDPPSWGYNTAGTHEFGYTSNYFYGSSGLPVDDQKLYDESNPLRIKGTISQPNLPTFDLPTFNSATAFITSTKLTVNWEMVETRTPCYKYTITVDKVDGNKTSRVSLYTNIRAYDTTFIGTNSFKGDYRITIRCFAISGIDVYTTVNKSL
jgi:hypothetical protein